MPEDVKIDPVDLKKEDLEWKNFKQFQHRYLVNIPNGAEDIHSFTDTFKHFHFPHPITNPVSIRDHNLNINLFTNNSKTDTRMEYYRKLFVKDKFLSQAVKKKKIIELPQYVLDVIESEETRDSYGTWQYTGGVLDTFYLDDKDYIVSSGLSQTPQIKKIDDCNIVFNLNIEDTLTTYCIKTLTELDYVLVSLRHKYKTSVIQISMESGMLQEDLLCRTTSNDIYTDMAFNPLRNKEYATLTNTHKLRILDLENFKVRLKHVFNTDENGTLPDALAQIQFVDSNTICFMNRCCIYLLDLRSLQTQKLCFKGSWLECDDLCCLSKNHQDINSLYVASKHKLTHVDLRLLKQGNHTLHMLSSSPFISSMQQTGFKENICLYGEQINDQVIIQDFGTFSTPLYIPNIMDTLTNASLTNRFMFYEEIEQRLSLPILGMKLHKDIGTDDIVLYTSNAAGDIFKQKLLIDPYDDVNAASKLVEWIQMIPQRPPKTLEVTSVCNLNKLMHIITNNFPHEKNLKRLVGKNMCQKFKKRFGNVTPYLQNSVGAAINSIWDDIIVDPDDVGPSATAENKVSDWLSSVP